MNHQTQTLSAPTGHTVREHTMTAIVQRTYGSADQLLVETVSIPEIDSDELLLRVRAAGVDRGTWHVMTGLPYLGRVALGLRRPKQPTPGLDVAGTVVAVGSAVTRFAVGDSVFGIAKGSFAQFAPALERKLVHQPAGASEVEAAVVAVSGLTALAAVIDVGRVKPGQAVLITGASGGVGSYALQIAVAHGANVTAVCSAGKAEFVRSLGAKQVIDYACEDITQGTVTYDLIIDIAGNTPTRRLRRILSPTGTLVIVGGEAGGRITGGFGRGFRAAMRSPFVRQKLATVLPKESHVGLARLATMIDAGQIRPAIGATFELSEARSAVNYLESGQVCGKIAITVKHDEMS